MKPSTLEDLKARVQVNLDTGCHEWKGAIQLNGYGVLVFAGRDHRAHRFFYELAKGKIPAGLYICHKCHNKRCVNPEHLYAGTQAENMRDMVQAGRQAIGEKIAKHKRGAANAAAKRTVDQVRHIRLSWSGGESQSAIARRLGISLTSIHRIVRNQSWRDCS